VNALAAASTHVITMFSHIFPIQTATSLATTTSTCHSTPTYLRAYCVEFETAPTPIPENVFPLGHPLLLNTHPGAISRSYTYDPVTDKDKNQDVCFLRKFLWLTRMDLHLRNDGAIAREMARR
jgi:hypothetical protein